MTVHENLMAGRPDIRSSSRLSLASPLEFSCPLMHCFRFLKMLSMAFIYIYDRFGNNGMTMARNQDCPTDKAPTRDEFNKLHQAVAALQDSFAQGERRQGEFDRTNAELKQDLQILREKLNKAEQTIEELELKLQQQENQHENTRIELATAYEDRKALENRIKELEDDFKISKDQFAQLERQVSRLDLGKIVKVQRSGGHDDLHYDLPSKMSNNF